MNDKLLELFILTGKRNFEFRYKIIEDMTENNISIDKDNKIISVTLSNPENENLSSIIENVIKQLE